MERASSIVLMQRYERKVHITCLVPSDVKQGNLGNKKKSIVRTDSVDRQLPNNT